MHKPAGWRTHPACRRVYDSDTRRRLRYYCPGSRRREGRRSSRPPASTNLRLALSRPAHRLAVTRRNLPTMRAQRLHAGRTCQDQSFSSSPLPDPRNGSTVTFGAPAAIPSQERNQRLWRQSQRRFEFQPSTIVRVRRAHLDDAEPIAALMAQLGYAVAAPDVSGSPPAPGGAARRFRRDRWRAGRWMGGPFGRRGVRRRLRRVPRRLRRRRGRSKPRRRPATPRSRRVPGAGTRLCQRFGCSPTCCASAPIRSTSATVIRRSRRSINCARRCHSETTVEANAYRNLMRNAVLTGLVSRCAQSWRRRLRWRRKTSLR